MKYVDISQTITAGMKKYPSDPVIEIRQFKSIKKGNSCNLYELSFGSHTGTHIDAPRHIFNGAKTVDNIKIKDLIRDVVVTDIDEVLKSGFFEKLKRMGIRGILLKKGKSMAELTDKAAKLLVRNGIRLVGTEEMSIEGSSDKSHPVHCILLSKGIIIIEGLDLKKAKRGYCRLICLPLKIKNADGAPVRAVLGYD